MPTKKKAPRSTHAKRARKKNDLVPTMLRMREDLRKRIEVAAHKRGQSMNEEMVGRLEMSFMLERMEARDTAIVELLTGGKVASAALLRNFIVELQRRPTWNFSEEGRKELIQRLSAHIMDPRNAAYELYLAQLDFTKIDTQFPKAGDAQRNEAEG